ncbi:MAG: SpoIIE family protein phosphatase, partial [Oscillospiraceae bacterium]|nr:SpoIIE family protein phosphatase [Oscillospiraceae bacterium]
MKNEKPAAGTGGKFAGEASRRHGIFGVGQAALSTVGARRAGLLFLRFLIGFCLTHARIFEVNAPLGVAWAATAPSGAEGTAAILGVLSGYLTIWGRVDAVKYIAISLLVYVAGIVFRKTVLGDHAAFMPALTAIVGGLVGLVFLFGDGPSAERALLFVTDTLIMAAMALFYRMAFATGFSEWRIKRDMSLLLLAASVFLSLSGLSVLGVLHPGRIAAGIFVLYSAWQGGIGVGCSSGLIVGLALDLGVGYPFFSMALGFAGLLAGVFRRMGKLAMIIVYILGCGISALWAGTETLRLSVILETFAVSVIAMLLPFRAGAREAAFDYEEPLMAARDSGKRIQNLARRRLTGASSSFRELYESLTGVFDRDRHKNDNDIAMVYDRVADRVCRRCRMRSQCWDAHNAETCHALADASGKLLKNNRASAADFPSYFSHRCIQLGAFTNAANEELEAMLQRRRYRSRLMENRRQVCRQYAEMSRILGDVADEVEQGIEFDEDAERQVTRFLESINLNAHVSVFRTSGGRRRVELYGASEGTLSALAAEPGFIRSLSGYAGFMLSLPEERHTPEGERLLFPEAEALDAKVGAVSHKKQGERVSGDCGAWFKTDKGNVYLILADGMGSGQDAARDSAEACRLLERFLRAGIAPEISLEMLNSSLVLRSEVDTSYVTVDLLICDLFTGAATIYKHGASASYIKRGDQVQRVNGRSLPAGARLNTADTTHFTLKPGDTMLLVSDGIAGPGDDDWLRDSLASFDAEGPRDLAERILE